MATSFLAISLAWATLFALYPHSGALLRPLVCAGFFAFVIALGWIFMPLNRPSLRATGLWIAMAWSFFSAVGIVVHLHSGALRSDELIALSISVTVFLVGIYVSRYTRWGRKHFNRR